MVGSDGLEPTTRPLWAARSNQLSYEPVKTTDIFWLQYLLSLVKRFSEQKTTCSSQKSVLAFSYFNNY